MLHSCPEMAFVSRPENQNLAVHPMFAITNAVFRAIGELFAGISLFSCCRRDSAVPDVVKSKGNKGLVDPVKPCNPIASVARGLVKSVTSGPNASTHHRNDSTVTTVEQESVPAGSHMKEYQDDLEQMKNRVEARETRLLENGEIVSNRPSGLPGNGGNDYKLFKNALVGNPKIEVEEVEIDVWVKADYLSDIDKLRISFSGCGDYYFDCERSSNTINTESSLYPSHKLDKVVKQVLFELTQHNPGTCLQFPLSNAEVQEFQKAAKDRPILTQPIILSKKYFR